MNSRCPPSISRMRVQTCEIYSAVHHLIKWGNVSMNELAEWKISSALEDDDVDDDTQRMKEHYGQPDPLAHHSARIFECFVNWTWNKSDKRVKIQQTWTAQWSMRLRVFVSFLCLSKCLAVDIHSIIHQTEDSKKSRAEIEGDCDTNSTCDGILWQATIFLSALISCLMLWQRGLKIMQDRWT